jgi:hypothetical protein
MTGPAGIRPRANALLESGQFRGNLVLLMPEWQSNRHCARQCSSPIPFSELNE